MPLDPHANKILEMLNAAGAADLSRMTPGEMREGFERLAALVGVNGVAVDAAEDRDIPGAGPIPVRVYAPKGSGSATLPGLIYFHGGGGVFGSIASHDSLCRLLANAGTCRVVSVGYRLAPGTDLADPRISPLLAEDLSRLPPAQVHTAEFDPLRSEGAAYADRLQRAGVAVRHTCHAGMIHHFYAMGAVIPYAHTAVAAAGAAIRSALA
jgi:acetyl esterase/lipase